MENGIVDVSKNSELGMWMMEGANSVYLGIDRVTGDVKYIGASKSLLDYEVIDGMEN